MFFKVANNSKLYYWINIVMELHITACEFTIILRFYFCKIDIAFVAAVFSPSINYFPKNMASVHPSKVYLLKIAVGMGMYFVSKKEPGMIGFFSSTTNIFCGL